MVLYKYMPSELGLQVLNKRQVRFTPPGDFNDPFEFNPLVGPVLTGDQEREAIIDAATEDALGQVCTTLGLGLGARELLRASLPRLMPGYRTELESLIAVAEAQFREMIPSTFHEKMNELVGVLCLSEVPDSLLMWGHYAEAHRGIVVGFDSEHPFFSKRRSPHDECGHLRRVEYRRMRPSPPLRQANAAEWFQTKSEEWAYEKEWRIMRVLTEADDRREVGRKYPICLFRFEPDVVREIVIGMRASDAVVAQVRALASECPRAKVCAARMHRTDYALAFEDLTAT